MSSIELGEKTIIEDFLGKREKKILKLLGHIIESQRKVFLLKELSKQLNQDIRVLIGTIHDSNNLDLREYGLRLEIVRETLVVSVEMTFSISRLKQELLRKSLLFMLCRSLFENKFSNLLNFSIDNFVSISTMYRQVKLLKKVLREYDVELDLSHTTYFLGSEKQIRHFYFELYFSAYGFSEVYAKAAPIDLLLINKVAKNSLRDVSFPLLQKVKLFTFISLVRIKHNNLLLESFAPFNSYDIQLSSIKLREYYTTVLLEYEWEKGNQFMERELNLFLAYLLTIDIISIEHFEMINYKEINQNDANFTMANKWIKDFCLFFQVEISAKVYFFFYINLYYFFSRMELVSQSSIYNLDSQHIYDILEKDNRYILNKTIQFCEKLQKDKSYPNTIVTIYFFFMLIRDVLFSLKQVIVCVISSLSNSQKANIELKVGCYSLVPVTFLEKITEEVDLIISDYYFENDLPMLFTSVFPTEREYEVIGEEILAIYDASVFSS